MPSLQRHAAAAAPTAATQCTGTRPLFSRACLSPLRRPLHWPPRRGRGPRGRGTCPWLCCCPRGPRPSIRAEQGRQGLRGRITTKGRTGPNLQAHKDEEHENLAPLGGTAAGAAGRAGRPRRLESDPVTDPAATLGLKMQQRRQSKDFN